MSKALDVRAAAKPEDYVSNQTTEVYGMLPVRLGCPVSEPLVRQLQCCLSLSPLNKLLAEDQERLGEGITESLRVPTSVCREGETPQEAARRAYAAHYSATLGPISDLWCPSFVPPIVNYHQLATGDTQVQTFFVAVCPPKVTGGSTSESSALVSELAEQLVAAPEPAVARLPKVVSQLLARNRWSPEQTSFAIIMQVAEALVKTELKPAADGWYDPNSILTIAEYMFERESMRLLLNGLVHCTDGCDEEGWSAAVLCAVELLCVRWNIHASLAPMVRNLLGDQLTGHGHGHGQRVYKQQP
jgi:hypothetical protein